MTLDFGDIAAQPLMAAFLVFLRIGAAMALLPAFGEMVVPVRVRLMATLAFTMIVFPAVAAQATGAIASGRSLAALGAAEVGAGLMLGFSLRLVVMALHVAGSIAAQATSLSQLLGGAAVDPQPALGLVLLWAALALAASLGLHVRFAAMFIQSYDLIAAGHFPAASQVASWIVPAISRMFEFGFLAAMPFVAASLLYNLTLGVINKAMPQLMVAFVGAPAITLGALGLLWLAAPVILTLWVDFLEARTAQPFGMR